ncbi:hypothetical protein M0R72_10015 [Candidatus Pacearchaeota archaeon]|jgi:hypothetical protein|nr:hypothetical protein [Candidatus Pacearchaeota archaeon]
MGKIKEKLEKIINTDPINLVPGSLYFVNGIFGTVLSVFTNIESYNYFKKADSNNGIALGALSVAAGIIGVCSYFNSVKYLKKK